jgi:methionyl-tRNA synthetase
MSFVPCDHEYLNFHGGKFSRSRGGTVDVPYFLSRYDPDPLRFSLTAVAPETRGTEACPACPERSRGEGLEAFAWEDFVERNNPVLPAPVVAAQVSASEGMS